MSWQFGPYRVESLIARGGMGEVLRAYDSRHDRVVALKLLAPEFAADRDFQERFRREAHAVARLREPHVIPIHAYGEIDGRLYLDMRLVDGDDLGSRLAAGGPLAPAEAVDVVGQVAQALAAAHAEGLVHRDVKPSNVLVGATGFAYLVDFGIARAAGPATGITATGGAVGTLDYMAPERFTDAPADHRVDVYSLACVLHQCLTGSKPFTATTAASLIGAHLHQPPPLPSALRPGLPAAFDAVIARGMAKDPAVRFGSVTELAAAARAALGGTSPVQAPAPPTRHATRLTAVPEPKRPSKAPWLVAGVALLALLAVVGWFTVLKPSSPVASGSTPPSTPPSTLPSTTSSAVPPMTAPPVTTTRISVRTSVATSVASSADLGLTTALSTPACDGSFVVILGSAITPARYRADVEGFLDAHPGAGYLHAPSTGCGSLRQQVDGADVYAVYSGPFATKDAACAHRSGGAYVKRLDNTTAPTQVVNC
ncbi:serine/threonine protein kinase [Amycolatopsis pretoriensis]|uniref:non-specific serine/threonine protein kinase n=1 Tax=Amycolatopsis pretoriensis TaxID=218821 RepID=A0A1H5Q5X9_9PSEU|nr:serine/threonine-protein kinase [Amycolatopsis pretoriensis]SEF20821.1 serine/threonine protein kinase [Amycolatopsis pretoriensis]